MAPCTFADDAYLTAHFPGVVNYAAEVWLVTVLAAQVGPYTVTLGGVPYVYTAGAGATVADVQAGLQALLGGLFDVAVSPVGTTALTLAGAVDGPLGVTVTGPVIGTISAALVSGGDKGAAFRGVWLERAKCGLPPCAWVTCADDFTLMHAALAASLANRFAAASGSGGGGASGAGNWSSMRLGPASITRTSTAWTSPAEAAMSDNGGPGDLFLSIRARYVFGVFCVSC